MGRIKDLNSALPGENDAFAFDGANGTKRISYAEFKQKLIDDGFGSGSSEAVVLTQAEYDALSDELKDSDTIFFISDAPFENSNVVTLTRAEYDALSDATKNDGRFYYVTDEEEVAKSLVVQTNVNSADTVPSSAVVYSGLNSKVNTSDIVNALNDSSTNKPLSANMGKQLNDSLTGLVKWASLSYAYSIDSNASLPVSGTSLGLTIPSGYTAMAIKNINTNNGNVVPRAITAPSQSSYDVCILKNLASSAQTGTLNVAIMFVKSSSVSTV